MTHLAHPTRTQLAVLEPPLPEAPSPEPSPEAILPESLLPEALLPATYTAYAYSYPHKSSYRPLRPPVSLAEAWRFEPRQALFLYVHLPFCEMRCGFCNLFTFAQPRHNLIDAYLDALERQACVVRAVMPQATCARLALGGGTPTYLNGAQLNRVFDIVESAWNVNPHDTPASVETSPATADDERLAVLEERGVERISIGVQSFIEAEAHALGRPQDNATVYRALQGIRRRRFGVLNIDLIYGAANQTVASWLFSLREALRFDPEELFLYPLYVRPQTGLGRRHDQPLGIRPTLYRAGRDLLLERGYEQVSMRCFRRPGRSSPATPYCCQRDGMVGLGCGARSYTSRLHYGTPFAVNQTDIQTLLRAWIASTDAAFAEASYGIQLSDDERRRRFVIQSLLHVTGFDRHAYREMFGGEPYADVPELAMLLERGLVQRAGDRLCLTTLGLEQSDAIGPALYSASVRQALDEAMRP